MQPVTTEPAVATPTSIDPAETKLADEIGDLWKVHSQAQGALRKTREELREIRQSLSQRLHELKSVLSRPGRGGAWSSFLNSQRIPRSSADRLVRQHEKVLAGDTGSCTTEQITEPTEAMVRRYFHALWPKLSRVLATREAVELFIAELRAATEKRPSVDVLSPGSTEPLGTAEAVNS